MRILIAEDERRLAGAIARGLRREGMAVDITHDGASALVKARVVDYDVVVLDRDLPELHGDEVCRLLSTDERETKVLMLTAADTTDDLVDGLALGADDYLPKPFHWPELVARIHALARRAGRARPPGPPAGPGAAAGPAPRRPRGRPGAPRGAPQRRGPRPHAQGVRRPRGPAVVRRPRGVDRGAARAGVGRARRPVHEHRADVRHDAAPQARRPARHQNGHRRRLPRVALRSVAAMRPTVRLKMTLLYAGVFFVAGALLLSVSYVLVRQNLTNPSNLRNLPPDNWTSNVAAQHEIAQDALARLRTQYGIALVAMTGLSVLLGWALAGRMLRPLQRITATAQRVSQDNLDERIGLEGPRDELKELADTFDGMLERLSGAFASQRRFVANASHELRTPLTVIRTELEVTLSDPRATTAELRAMGETVRDATLDTERLIQALLTLARWEGGNARHDPLDLADAARRALAQTASEAAARGLDM